MPRRERPPSVSRSEHWLRQTIEHPHQLDGQLKKSFGWPENEVITWVSPVEKDGYAEYFDAEFLERLGIEELKEPLDQFWPISGPRWDGLGRTDSGRVILVEAKAYIEEGVDYGSKATSRSLQRILSALEEAKTAFRARDEARWDTPFYQYANRLAHLYFLAEKNGLDAYLVFLYFANAPDVPSPCSPEQWNGAIRLTEKCLGIGNHPYRNRVASVIIDLAGSR